MTEKVVFQEEYPGNELVVISAKPGDDIVTNIAQVRDWVLAKLEEYNAWEIADEEEYKQAKRDRADLNRLKGAIDQVRKNKKAEYLAPLNAFEDEVKTVTAPIDDVVGALKREIDAYDARWADVRRANLRRHYEEFAPLIALPLEGQDAPLLPFSRIDDDRWYHRTTTEMAAMQELEDIIERIAREESTLKDLNLAHPEEARAEYFATLDLNAAIKRSADIEEHERMVAALDEVTKGYEMPVDEPEPETPTDTPTEPERAAEGTTAPQTDEDTPRPYRIYLTCTPRELAELVEWFKTHGIHGEVRANG